MRIPGIPFAQARNWAADPATKTGIAIHNTSNTAAAAAEAAYAARRTDDVSTHFVVDGGEVIQCLDTDVKAWHAGSSQGNTYAVAVEIVGTNDKTRDWWLTNVAWDALGAVLAQVCTRYGIAVRRAAVAEMKADPRVKAFYGHDDMRRAWGGTTHTDPGPTFPWDRLFKAVNDAMTRDVDMIPISGHLPVLKQGDQDPVTDAGVTWIHRAQRGLQVDADGVYGPATAAAVKAMMVDDDSRSSSNGTVIGAGEWRHLIGMWS